MGQTLEAGWPEWSRSLAIVCRDYKRPSGLISMTTDNELCFLESYARWSFTGSGSIIDLGCWLGATTIALARGLAQNTLARDRRVVEGIDRFVWQPWMNTVTAQLGVRLPYRVGEEFLKDVERGVAPYGAPVLSCKIGFLLERGRGRAALREAEAFGRRGIKASPNVVADVLALAPEH